MLSIKTCATALLLAAIAPSASSAQASPQSASRRMDGSASNRLRVHVYPSICMAPASVRIEAYVEPASENRELEIAIDSAGYYRSSTIELSGTGAARTHRVVFQGVPAGDHQVRVVLRDGGSQVRAILHHRVVCLE